MSYREAQTRYDNQDPPEDHDWREIPQKHPICRMCNGEGSHLIGVGNGWDVVECRNCKGRGREGLPEEEEE